MTKNEMTNQAAQTMPELPEPQVMAGHHSMPTYYTSAQLRAYGQACYEAGLNAGRHPDALPDGTLSKSTVKRVTALAAASVSERARASMKLLRFGRGNGLTPWILEPRIDGYWTPWHTAQSELDMAVESSKQFERALEQALTQQRGEPVAWRYIHVIDGDSGSWQPMENLTPAYRKRLTDDGCEFEFAYAATTPQPSADAVRELVRRWRECAKSAANGPMFDGASEYAVAGTYIACADELESLLSAASGEKGVG